MARVECATQSWGQLVRPGTNQPLPGAIPQIGTTVYTAAVGGTPIPANQWVSNTDGLMPGFVDTGTWPFTEPDGTVRTVEAVSAADLPSAGQIADIAVIREAPLNLEYPEYAGLVTGGNWRPALQALVNQGDTVEGYIGPGEFDIAGTVSRTIPKGLKLKGAGMGVTFLRETQDAHLLDLVLASGPGRLTLEDMTLVPARSSPLLAGSAVRVDGNYNWPGFQARNVEVAINGTVSEFRRGVEIINGAEVALDNVTVVGLGGANLCEAVYLTSSKAATGGSFSLVNVAAYNTKYGLRAISQHSPGTEGIQINQCDWVGCETGISAVAAAAGSFPPMLEIVGGHTNCYYRNVVIDKYSQCKIIGHLAYNFGTAEFFRFIDVNMLTVTDNDLITVLDGDPDGIYLAGPAGLLSWLTIANNRIALKPGSAKWPITKPNTDSLIYAKIHDNIAGNSPRFTNIDYTPASVEIRGNSPRDPLDGVQSMPVLGTGSQTTLSAALSTAAPITSLPVAALTVALPLGTIVTVDDGAGHVQQWGLTAAAAVGATSLTVGSQTPNFAYPSGTPVTDPYRLDLAGIRAPMITVVSGGNKLVTSIPAKWAGQEITISASDHVIQHNARIILKGAVDFAFPAGGGTITLRYSGVSWYEVGRAA